MAVMAFIRQRGLPKLTIARQRHQQTSLLCSTSRLTASPSSASLPREATLGRGRAVATDSHLSDLLTEAAAKPQTGVSLKELIDFGATVTPNTLVHAGNFLRNELPVRFAHRVRDLDDLPHGLSDMPSVKQVRQWYVDSFAELLRFPRITSVSQEQEFTTVIRSILERHSGTLVTMARGVHELKVEHAARDDLRGLSEVELLEHFSELHTLHEFLDAFYMSRIGIRMLIGQHIALHTEQAGWVGAICKHTSAHNVAMDAIQDAVHVCFREYGDAPEVVVQGQTKLTFPYVPSHLHHMLFEVLKNSLGATCEHYADQALPPVKIIIADGDDFEDISIKVSDEGGGIRRSNMRRIFSYLFTTAGPGAFDALSDSPDFGGGTPLAGLGYGLPISRLFARYFGGNLQVISMEGYGTDAYLHLKRVGDSPEPLP